MRSDFVLSTEIVEQSPVVISVTGSRRRADFFIKAGSGRSLLTKVGQMLKVLSQDTSKTFGTKMSQRLMSAVPLVPAPEDFMFSQEVRLIIRMDVQDSAVLCSFYVPSPKGFIVVFRSSGGDTSLSGKVPTKVLDVALSGRRICSL